MTQTCAECGAEHESLEDYEQDTIQEIGEDEDGSLSLYGKKNLYRCKDCRKAMAVGHSH